MQQQQMRPPAQAQSTLFAMDMTRAAVSSVLYLRGIFPEHTFRDAEISTVRVRNLDPNADDVLARQLCRFVEDGLLKAIELNVLSSVDLLISQSGSAEPGDLLEKYTFVFSSAGDLAMGGDPIKSVQMMLRKLLITTETLAPLQCDVRVSFRLHYQPDVPDDFEPRWFGPGGASIEFDNLDNKEPLQLHLGSVVKDARAFEMSFQGHPEIARHSPTPVVMRRRRDRENESSTLHQPSPRPTLTEAEAESQQHKRKRKTTAKR